MLGSFRLLFFVGLQGCALRALAVFETRDAGSAAPVDADTDASYPACVDDPDAGDDPRKSTPGCTCLLRGHEYMICNVQASWPDAESDCEKHGMQLVRIDDATENAWVHAVAFSSPGIDRNWLGGSDLGAAGDWRWADGAQFWSGAETGNPVGGLYTNWDAGEPNDMGDVEHCLVMFDKTTWNDDNCATTHRYVCEGQ